MDEDLAYHRRRAAEERRAGMTAASHQARRCHSELAAGYERRLKELAVKKRRATFHIVIAA